jgi:hypothetical protein
MNVTPKTMVAQIAAARAVVPFGGDRLAYSTRTGDAPRVYTEAFAPVVEDEHDPHCFVCGRHTNHFAEHDDMVEQGFAQYEQDGSVTWTEKGWNEYRA